MRAKQFHSKQTETPKWADILSLLVCILFAWTFHSDSPHSLAIPQLPTYVQNCIPLRHEPVVKREAASSVVLKGMLCSAGGRVYRKPGSVNWTGVAGRPTESPTESGVPSQQIKEQA